MTRITKYESHEYPNNLWKHQVSVYLKNFDNEEILTFFKRNMSALEDSGGYRPWYYIADSLMEWLYDNFGNGSNGKLVGTLFYQGWDDENINWWIGWSYCHKYGVHYITVYFKNKPDAMFFKLRWG
jgi:hypothetical protein